MGYQVGVDMGTTYTAAAVLRGGRAEIASLGDRAAAIPSVVFLRPDETVLTGEAASRRGLADPSRVARAFKRRLGDPTPILLGGSPYSAEALTAKLLRWVLDSVSAREGGPPDMVTITHPANWGPYKKDLLGQAIHLADLDRSRTLTEPEAAAICYASTERVTAGDVVAVYDLGGGTFDAAVLRKTATGFEILGPPEGIERLGGIDFDEAILAHVFRAAGVAPSDLDPDDPTAVAALARLREECAVAKETLSTDTEVSVPVFLPRTQSEVRLTRAEFESMIRPTLADTMAALRRSLRSAKVTPADVHAVLLVGGSSRIPLVATLVSAELGRPVKVDAHPKHAIALGAALSMESTGAPKPVVAPAENHDARSTRTLTRPVPPVGGPPPGPTPPRPRPAQPTGRPGTPAPPKPLARPTVKPGPKPSRATVRMERPAPPGDTPPPAPAPSSPAAPPPDMTQAIPRPDPTPTAPVAGPVPAPKAGDANRVPVIVAVVAVVLAVVVIALGQPVIGVVLLVLGLGAGALLARQGAKSAAKGGGG